MTKILDYLSIIHIEMEEHTSEYDQHLADFDDGEKIGQVEAKNIALNLLDQTVIEIIELRNKIANQPLSKLQEEYLK